MTDAREHILGHVIESPHSTFYRERLSHISLSAPLSSDVWEQIPLLTKEDIRVVPLNERTFVPAKDVDVIRATSGTSGRGVLLIPRSNLRAMPTAQCPVSDIRIMAFFYPHHLVKIPFEKSGAAAIGGDPSDVEGSAAIAHVFGVTAATGLPHILLAFAEALVKAGTADQLHTLYLASDRVTRAQLEALRDLVPHVRLSVLYASAEGQGIIASSCLQHPDRPTTLHPFPEYYWELIDPESGTVVSPKENASGELVLTTLDSNEAFPLIRYRTGDEARYTIVECACGNGAGFEILGRVEMDTIRIPGGEIKTAEVERALHEFPVFGPDYEVHIDEVHDQEGSSRVQIHLLLTPHDSTHPIEHYAEDMARALRVSASRTYADGVASDLYLPLICDLLTPRKTDGKIVRLFDHRN